MLAVVVSNSMASFSTLGECGSIRPCTVGAWATITLATVLATLVMLCNLFCPPLANFFISDKQNRLQTRRWMRAARSAMIDVYHFNMVVHRDGIVDSSDVTVSKKHISKDKNDTSLLFKEIEIPNSTA